MVMIVINAVLWGQFTFDKVAQKRGDSWQSLLCSSASSTVGPWESRLPAFQHLPGLVEWL